MIHPRTLIAIVLLCALTPGSIAAAEDLSHVAMFGHTMHSDSGVPGHGAIDPEHGCTATFHLCSCHTALSAVAVAARHELPLDLDSANLWIVRCLNLTDDCRSEVFRPPRFLS